MEKYTGYIVTALLVIVVVLFGTFIGSDTPNIDVNVNIDGSQPSSIGALGDPNPTSLDADEWTAMNDLYIDDLEVSDDALISGNLEVSGSLVVDGAIGELSQFHDTYDYYGHGIDLKNVVLPKGTYSVFPVLHSNLIFMN